MKRSAPTAARLGRIVSDDPEGVEENAPDFAGNALVKVRAITVRNRGS